MAKKNAMFYTSLGRGDHARFMLLAAMLCAETPDQVAAVDAYAPDIRAWIASLQPPAFRWPVDAALADRGKSVFEATCSRCHGTYGPGGSYPDLVIPLDTVGTDPAYALAATDGSEDRFYDWAARSPYGPSVRTAPARGYSAPPLDGVWATAPYLHNGAVPDMVGLLDSTRRPAFWRHLTDPREYDPATLGWRHEVLDHGQDGEPDPALRRLIYDTTLPGHGNGGHSFGDRLSPEDRKALIEYLKTL
jgi:mono/diheme cytochrome c family protein